MNGLQQVVEFVGDSPRQRSDGFHLLCLTKLLVALAQRLLDSLAERDISNNEG